MQLYGTTTSPYVRRVRVVAHEVGRKVTLRDINQDDVQAEMRAKNPLWKVPTAELDGRVLFDSHIIIEYLLARAGGSPLRKVEGDEVWREKTLLAAIDGALD